MSLMRARATDPPTLNFSQRTALVMQRIFGTSLIILSYYFASRNTALLSFSLTLTLVHDFFFALAPPLDFAPWAFLEAVLPASFVATCAFLAYNNQNIMRKNRVFPLTICLNNNKLLLSLYISINQSFDIGIILSMEIK
jgi:hypothetical protein